MLTPPDGIILQKNIVDVISMFANYLTSLISFQYFTELNKHIKSTHFKKNKVDTPQDGICPHCGEVINYRIRSNTAPLLNSTPPPQFSC